MSVSISIHVDGYYGLTKGIENLLSLFEKYGVRASFFINMGDEASILDLLRYRSRGENKMDMKISNRYTKKELIRMLLFPRKLGHAHKEVLRKIIDKGHEVNPHCWSHLRWSKNFERIDFEKEIKKMKEAFYKCIGKNPKGFSPPTWKINEKVLGVLKKQGFEYVGVNKGEISEKMGIKIIPLSFQKNIEELLMEGKSEQEVLDIYKDEFKKSYVNLYFHADFEGLRG